VLRAIASFLSGYAFQHAGLGVTSDLRTDLCDHWLHQSNRFHSEHSSGELFSRMVSDIDKMQNAVSNQLLDLLQQSAAAAGDDRAAVLDPLQARHICLIAAPAIVFPIYRIGAACGRPAIAARSGWPSSRACLTEMVRGHRIVKAFGMEEFELARFRRATDRHLRVNLRRRCCRASRRRWSRS
jgi:subfamily B ATP-binding cassette protein MsbA